VSRRQEHGLALWAFDLLFAVGKDIRGLPYIERNERLASRWRAPTSAPCATWSIWLLTECGKRGLEGIVFKRRDSSYRSGKQTTWIKVKCPAWRETNRERHKLFENR
jgi:bifunctional non-homologous end joining protein LigD